MSADDLRSRAPHHWVRLGLLTGSALMAFLGVIISSSLGFVLSLVALAVWGLTVLCEVRTLRRTRAPGEAGETANRQPLARRLLLYFWLILLCIVGVTEGVVLLITSPRDHGPAGPLVLKQAVDFAAPNNSGFWLPNGVTGAGVDSTVYEIKPWTSTKASIGNTLVPDQTNPYRVMKVGSTSSSAPAQNLNVSDFTLQGTPQGHNYGGLQILYADHPTIHDLKILGPIVGNAPGPPGETFVLESWRTNHPTFTDLLLDGHDPAGNRDAGTIDGSSYLPNGGSWTRVKFTGAAGGFGTAIFQASHGDFVWTDCEWTDNRQHINIEDSKGDATYTFVRPKFGSIAGDSRYVAQISSKTSSAKVTFVDPIVKSWPLTVRWYPNSGTQLKSDIRLIINGVDVSNDPTKLAFINF